MSICAKAKDLNPGTKQKRTNDDVEADYKLR